MVENTVYRCVLGIMLDAGVTKGNKYCIRVYWEETDVNRSRKYNITCEMTSELCSGCCKSTEEGHTPDLRVQRKVEW